MPVRSGNVNIGMCVSFGETVGVSVKTEVYVLEMSRVTYNGRMPCIAFWFYEQK